MGDIKRRLYRLEGETRTEPKDERKREKDREGALHMAESSNREGRRDGREPFFEITESGDVFSVHDGRLITDGRQALCEQWCWQYLAWGVKGHDEETEAFYTPEGEFALSRTDFDLRGVFRLTSGGGGVSYGLVFRYQR